MLEVMKDRRSIRKYKKEPLSDDTLTRVLEAVQCTQSWKNTQCWELVVIDDPDIRKAVQEAVPSLNPAHNAIVDASVLIVLCGKVNYSGCTNGKPDTKLGDWYMYDLGLATQNLCNCAHELGLGTVVVGWFEHDKVKKVIELPEGYEVVTLIPLGYPDHKGSSPKRKELSEFVSKNRFGNR
jgi:nitroreductase